MPTAVHGINVPDAQTVTFCVFIFSEWREGDEFCCLDQAFTCQADVATDWCKSNDLIQHFPDAG